MFRFSIPVLLLVVLGLSAPATSQLRISGHVHLGGGVHVGATFGHHGHHGHGYRGHGRGHGRGHHDRHRGHGRRHHGACHAHCGCGPIRVHRRVVVHRRSYCGPRFGRGYRY